MRLDMIKNKNAEGTGGSREEKANTTKLIMKSTIHLADQCRPFLFSHNATGSTTISI
jgi:hypothetical protein